MKDTNICISGEQGRSTCSGDSGGPLLMKNKGKINISSFIVRPNLLDIYKQIGITSFGSLITCESGIAAGFTRVSSYLKWIETITGIIIEN